MSIEPRVIYKDGVFICRVSYHDRHLPKDSGFRFSPEKKYWYTPYPSVAARLRDIAEPPAIVQMDKVLLKVSPWSKPLAVPKGYELKPYQIEPTLFLLSRNRSYIALDPGLGKTIVAAVACNTLQGWLTLYICPPFLTKTVEYEFYHWTEDKEVIRLDPKSKFMPTRHHNLPNTVYIVPDSIIDRKEVLKFIYDITRYSGSVNSMLIVDEAHRYKNENAKRTKRLFGHNMAKTQFIKEGIYSRFDKVALMSGTPMPNRPIELHHTLFKMAPETIDYMGKHFFGVEYCNAHLDGAHWNYGGASNLKRLRDRVIHPNGPFMYRLKKNVLDLPAKTEGIVLVDSKMSKTVARFNREVLNTLSPDDIMKEKIASNFDMYEGELHIATYRRLLSLEKTDFTTTFVKDILDTTDESVLLFGLHTEALDTLCSNLEKYKPLLVTGRTKAQDRHEIVKQFQTSKEHRLFIGQIQAAGVGLTLTKANRVVFHEPSWNPAENEQAGDRAHRIGQKKNVLVQYIVYDGSIDKAVLESNWQKRKSQAYV